MHAFDESHGSILPFSPGRGAAFPLGKRESLAFLPEWKKEVAVKSLFCLLVAEFVQRFTPECFTKNSTTESGCNSNRVYTIGASFTLFSTRTSGSITGGWQETQVTVFSREAAGT